MLWLLRFANLIKTNSKNFSTIYIRNFKDVSVNEKFIAYPANYTLNLLYRSSLNAKCTYNLISSIVAVKILSTHIIYN